ncbi:hypothetical protein FRB97_009739 [Tulasnella sp. 331]|nr:hypothetical protein FRB97_009739 [Tulasnella sp. 331]
MTTSLPTYNVVGPSDSSNVADFEELPAYEGSSTAEHLKFVALNQKFAQCTTFPIDKEYVLPFVLPSDLQAHLILLGAFHRLREEVRTQKGLSEVSMNPDEMWAVFLERAVHRFSCWANWINSTTMSDKGDNYWLEPLEARTLDSEQCPPLDVAMIAQAARPLSSHPGCLRKGLDMLKEAFLPSALLVEWSLTTLAVRKFYDDMESCITDPTHHVLANALVDYKTGVPMPDLAIKLTGMIFRLDSDPAYARNLLSRDRGWKFRNIEALSRYGYMGARNEASNPTPRGLSLILAPYRQAGPFSMDLASAVLRQMTFIEKMVNMGWTEDGRFEDDVHTLTRCVARYHAFLDLTASTPGKFVVPTLDIDLAWHTHQLLSTSYRKLHDIMGTVPDHDDKVNQGTLSTAWDSTAEAWKARFGVPYSVCGCAPPMKPASVGNVILSVFSRNGKDKASQSSKQVKNARPDLVSALDMSAEETHPSDHNAVALINPKKENEAQEQGRLQELVRREKELGRAAKLAHEGDWTEILASRNVDHTHAFLRPVVYGLTGPFGIYGHGDCAVYSGRVVKGNLGAGECVTGNGPNGTCGSVFFTQQREGLRDSVELGIIMASGITNSAVRLMNYRAERRSYADTSNPGYLAESMAWVTGGYAPDLQSGGAHCDQGRSTGEGDGGGTANCGGGGSNCSGGGGGCGGGDGN